MIRIARHGAEASDRPVKYEISRFGGNSITVAVDLIEAASKTSSHFIRPETGVGGPVDVLLLGYSEQPQRLHWKNEIRP
jgi:hypothetical protein